jgi:hypothetical protein
MIDMHASFVSRTALRAQGKGALWSAKYMITQARGLPFTHSNYTHETNSIILLRRQQSLPLSIAFTRPT